MGLLTEQDISALSVAAKALPHALIISADQGLDRDCAVQSLIESDDEISTIRPIEDKKITTVDQIRDFIAYISTRSTKRRVIVFDDSTSMSEQAQNVLLKSLEELTDNTHIIILASSTEGLLPAIISRCQIIRLHHTTRAEDSRLVDSYNLPATKKKQILFLASGKPLMIHQLSTSEELFDEYSSIINDAKLIVANTDNYSSLVKVQPYFKDRHRAMILLDTTVNIIHHLIKASGETNQRFDKLMDSIEKAKRTIDFHGSLKLSLLEIVV